MQKKWVDWLALILDVGEAVALEVADAAIQARRRQRRQKRLKR